MFPKKISGKIIIATLAAFVFLTPTFAAANGGELLLSGKFAALPVMAGVTQSIEIALPSDAPNGAFDAGIAAKSGWGVLLFPNGPSSEGQTRISKNSPVKLEYRWSGATPVNSSAAEVIAVDIPKLGLSGELEFQVGVDVRIKEITLPGDILPGIFNRIEIAVEDAFNPSLDVAELLREVKVPLEISLSLKGGSAAASAPNDDPVVNAFFSETGKTNELSYPGENFKPGSIVSEGGKFFWRGDEGRAAGITPPSGGTYSMEATLKASLGGVPLRHWASPPFHVLSGYAVASEGMPVFFDSTLTIMSRFDAGISSEAEKKAREFLASGDAKGAISSLGSALRKTFASSELPSLGKYSAALASSGRDEDEILNFLGLLMKGFSDYGVLLFTRSGLAEWSVKGGAGYENGRYVAVPFSSQKNIAIRLTGSTSDDVSLWKILGQGTNAKKYPKGNWIKEITVYTTEVKPPQTQSAN
jgi:hypothetical protein